MTERALSTVLHAIGACSHVGRHCYAAALPAGAPKGDRSDLPMQSGLRLLEDGVPLGPPYSAHDEITNQGGGRYSHWLDTLYFSSSDGSDPRTNGRSYQFVLVDRLQSLAYSKVAQIFDALKPDAADAQIYAALESAFLKLYPKALIGEDRKLFWEQRSFLETYSRLCGTNRRSAERKFTAVSLLGLVDHLDGDIAECGVYEGATAYFVAEALQKEGKAPLMHLFDSFEGLSDPQPIDGEFWAAGGLSVNESHARRNLQPFSNARFYKGWIPDRFAEVEDRSFSYVHIDVDLFQPTLDSLEFFYPRLLPGGLIVCDDYGFMTCPGAAAAMDRFFADRREKIVHLPTGQGFVRKLDA